MPPAASNPHPLALADASKLSVARLKVLCKDRKIAGYSRLGKQALLDKLILSGAVSGSTPSQRPPSETVRTADSQTEAVRTTPLGLDSSAPRAALDPAEKPDVRPESTRTHASVDIGPVISSQRLAPPSSLQRPAGSLRRRERDSTEPLSPPPPPKKQCLQGPSLPPREEKTGPLAQENNTEKTYRPVPRMRRPVPVGTPENSRPAPSTNELSRHSGRSIPPRFAHKRFRPLIVDKKKLLASSPKAKTTPPVPSPGPPESPLSLLEDIVAEVPALSAISLPPTIAQRKHVLRWAVILSGLSDSERAACVLVSRAFRYAGASLPRLVRTRPSRTPRPRARSVPLRLCRPRARLRRAPPARRRPAPAPRRDDERVAVPPRTRGGGGRAAAGLPRVVPRAGARAAGPPRAHRAAPVGEPGQPAPARGRSEVRAPRPSRPRCRPADVRLCAWRWAGSS